MNKSSRPHFCNIYSSIEKSTPEKVFVLVHHIGQEKLVSKLLCLDDTSTNANFLWLFW
jgi:hypothetical protein